MYVYVYEEKVGLHRGTNFCGRKVARLSLPPPHLRLLKHYFLCIAGSVMTKFKDQINT